LKHIFENSLIPIAAQKVRPISDQQREKREREIKRRRRGRGR
jgi:hypothetical protein